MWSLGEGRSRAAQTLRQWPPPRIVLTSERSALAIRNTPADTGAESLADDW
jgi:hypothetical protein